MTKAKTPSKIDAFWTAQAERRMAFAERFAREHHPGAGARRPLKPFAPPTPFEFNRNWPHVGTGWLHTNDSICRVAFGYLAGFFRQHRLWDHPWIIGHDEQEPYALVAEPYAPPATPETFAALRRDLERLGIELREYPASESPYLPNANAVPLVAHAPEMGDGDSIPYGLLAELGRQITAVCRDMTDDVAEYELEESE